MKIDFDPSKNEKNIKLRGLPFDRAVELDWEDAVIIQDTRINYPEDRFVAIEYSGPLFPMSPEARSNRSG